MNIGNGLIGEGLVQREVTLLTLGNLHLDRRRVTKQRGLPLVRFATDEPIEMVEALQRGPTVVRAGDAGFPVGNLMVLSNVLGAVSVLAQDFRHHRGTLGNLAGIPRIGIRELRDHSHAYGMVVSSGQESGTRRRAQSGSVKAGIAQTS